MNHLTRRGGGHTGKEQVGPRWGTTWTKRAAPWVAKPNRLRPCRASPEYDKRHFVPDGAHSRIADSVRNARGAPAVNSLTTEWFGLGVRPERDTQGRRKWGPGWGGQGRACSSPAAASMGHEVLLHLPLGPRKSPGSTQIPRVHANPLSTRRGIHEQPGDPSAPRPSQPLSRATLHPSPIHIRRGPQATADSTSRTQAGRAASGSVGQMPRRAER